MKSLRCYTIKVIWIGSSFVRSRMNGTLNECLTFIESRTVDKYKKTLFSSTSIYMDLGEKRAFTVPPKFVTFLRRLPYETFTLLKVYFDNRCSLETPDHAYLVNCST